MEKEKSFLVLLLVHGNLPVMYFCYSEAVSGIL